MSFMYPMGLLGLIGIPIVIIIYILRSKYNEQTVSSTYLWKLSDRFLKKRNPLSGLTGLLSLLLQILTIAAISIAIAHPIIILPDAANDYYFILDTSSSMHMEDGDETRFEKAKAEIIETIDDAAGGSAYSLICVSDSATTVFDGVTKKKTAIEIIEKLEPSYVTTNHTEAVKSAQECFEKNPSAFIYLVTDKSYKIHENLELMNIKDENDNNYAVTDVTYSNVEGMLSASANVISYLKDASLEVKLYVDDDPNPKKTVTVSAPAGVPTPVTLECTALSFSSFRVEIANSDIYSYDNSVIMYNLKSEKTFSTLLVSNTPFFLEAALRSILNTDITTMTIEEYKNNTVPYGLYIFDSCTPDKLPNGSVWLINATESVENAGFAIRDTISLGSEVVTLEMSRSTATNVRTILSGVQGNDISINKYIKYSGMYLDFMTLFSHDGNPLIFAGTNGEGNRQVVFGFDIHDTDMALSVDFITLLNNLIDYSFPLVVEKTNYTVGDEVLVNVVKNSDNLKAISPSGEEVYMESDGTTAILALDEMGTYVISVTISGVENTYRIYSGAHPDESVPDVEENDFSLAGEKGYEKRDGEYDPIVILFIALAVLFVADWGLYCYEKYQLR